MTPCGLALQINTGFQSRRGQSKMVDIYLVDIAILVTISLEGLEYA